MLLVSDLVNGVLHELNNPLSVLLGQSLALKERLAGTPNGPATERLARAAERCAQVARTFGALAREAPMQTRCIALNPLVEETLQLFKYPLGVAGVTLDLDLAPELPTLQADPRQVRLLVAALVQSALQAARGAPAPRLLCVSTRRHASQAAAILEVDHSGPTLRTSGASRLLAPAAQAEEGPDAEPSSMFLAEHLVASLGGKLEIGSAGLFARVELVGPPKRS